MILMMMLRMNHSMLAFCAVFNCLCLGFLNQADAFLVSHPRRSWDLRNGASDRPHHVPANMAQHNSTECDCIVSDVGCKQLLELQGFRCRATKTSRQAAFGLATSGLPGGRSESRCCRGSYQVLSADSNCSSAASNLGSRIANWLVLYMWLAGSTTEMGC